MDAVLVGVEPHVVTDRCGLDETEVDLRGRRCRSGQGDRRGGGELALAGVRAASRGTVGEGLRVVGQCDGVTVQGDVSGNDLNLVGTKRQVGEGVVTGGVGRRGDIRAGGILHGIPVAVEEAHGNALKRLVDSRIIRPCCVGVIEDGAGQGATNSEGRSGSVVRRVRIDLVEIAKACGVRNGRTRGTVLDLHEDVQGLCSANIEGDVGISRCNCLPCGGRRIVVSAGNRGCVCAGGCARGLADSRLRGDVLDARRQGILHRQARGNRGTIVLQVHLVEHVVAGHCRAGRFDGFGKSVCVANHLIAIHLDASDRLFDSNIGGNVDTDLGSFIRLQVGHLAVFNDATGQCNRVPCDEVRVDRRSHGCNELDFFSDFDIAVHNNAETGDCRQISGSSAPGVGGTSGRTGVHSSTRAHHLAAAGVLNGRVFHRDIRGRNSSCHGVLAGELLN